MPSFYIIRQPEDCYNPRLRHQDAPISQTGQEEARKLWPYLSDKQISAIYISGYLRTAQTIEHVASPLGISLVIDERLNEIANGSIEGMSD